MVLKGYLGRHDRPKHTAIVYIYINIGFGHSNYLSVRGDDEEIYMDKAQYNEDRRFTHCNTKA